jgi:hypothetical protein
MSDGGGTATSNSWAATIERARSAAASTQRNRYGFFVRLRPTVRLEAKSLRLRLKLLTQFLPEELAMLTKCAWVDCSATTERPTQEGWRLLKDHPGVSDGFYCRDHAALIEACEIQGAPLDEDDPI